MINRYSKTSNVENVEFSFNEKDLREAALILQEAFAEIQPRPVDLEHKFTESFSVRINSILSKQKIQFYVQRILKSIVAAVLIFIIGSGIWLSIDIEARAEFKSWLRTEYENSILYEFFGKKEISKISRVEFGWLPKGYTETTAMTDTGSGYYLFTNREGKDIVFCYTSICSDGILAISGDCMSYEKIEVNGMTADLYIALDEDEPNVLWWYDEEKEIAYELNAAIEKYALVKIAENIELKLE